MKELIQDNRIEKIIEDFKNLLIKKEVVSYNIFNLSSFNNHLEHFHSDIFASFLQPNGLHDEKDLFLNEFLIYLKNELGLNINLVDFKNTFVQREMGRLDLLIFDQDSKKAIIFENKMNDTPDTEEQLICYYNWCIKRNFDVVAIVYVSLQGLINMPHVNPKIKQNLRNVAVLSNMNSDLIVWLHACIEKAKNTETKSLLIQYCKLLTYLAFDSMEKLTMDEFYSIANDSKFLEKISTINELTCKIPSYRADKFQKAISDYAPFKNMYRYKHNVILFENYWDGQDSYKLDISFENDGSANIILWNSECQNVDGNNSLRQKVNLILYADKLIFDENLSWFIKQFHLNEYLTMKSIDENIVDFTKELMMKLNNCNNRKV